MSYIFKQKINLKDLAALENAKNKVLLYQPEEYLGALYSHYLRFHNFDVKHCQDIANLKFHIENFQPEILIYSIEGVSTPSVIASLATLKKHWPNTTVVTTGFNTDAQILKHLLTAGVASHINRCHSRPEDIVTITKTLLNH